MKLTFSIDLSLGLMKSNPNGELLCILSTLAADAESGDILRGWPSRGIRDSAGNEVGRIYAKD